MIMNGETRPRKVAGGKRQGVKSVDSEIHVPTSWQGIVEIILRGILLVSLQPSLAPPPPNPASYQTMSMGHFTTRL